MLRKASKKIVVSETLKKFFIFAGISIKKINKDALVALTISFHVMKLSQKVVLCADHILYSLLLDLQTSKPLSKFFTTREINKEDLLNYLETGSTSLEGIKEKKYLISIDSANIPHQNLKITDGVCNLLRVLKAIQRQTRKNISCLTLFVAIIIEGTTSVSASICSLQDDAFSRLSMGKLLKINLNKVLLTSNLSNLNMKVVNKNLVNDMPQFIPNVEVDFDIERITRKDAIVSNKVNWVIYPNLLIGGNPGSRIGDVRELLLLEDEVTGEAIGRTTFVSLMGEYKTFAQYFKTYPQAIQTNMKGEVGCMTFIHFPINDFETAEVKALADLVNELKRRLLRGERVLLHCRGGHGRTGMVIIPLIASLYNIDFENAADWVRKTYLVSRRGKRWQWRLPETRNQENTAREVVKYSEFVDLTSITSTLT